MKLRNLNGNRARNKKVGRIMGYPYGKTYLAEIQARSKECADVRTVFYALRAKYVKEHDAYEDDTELSIKENFALLGEAFEYGSEVAGLIDDPHHFMWDVLDALVPEPEIGK